MFEAILIEKDENGQIARLAEVSKDALPEGDVTIRVAWSTLNYKDALAITGKSPVVRRFPMVPGIDLAGVVEASSSPGWKPGDKVVLNGWGVGETHWGGLAHKARLKGAWLVPLEPAFSLSQAMAIGTAGYTAMLCVMALEKHGVTPGEGPVLVTGAAGGVGSVAVALLAKLGHEVVAVTGRLEEGDYLKRLGAAEILPRSEFSEPGRPLGKERWAGAVDVAGGQVLANVCASMRYRGTVAACGLAALGPRSRPGDPPRIARDRDARRMHPRCRSLAGGPSPGPRDRPTERCRISEAAVTASLSRCLSPISNFKEKRQCRPKTFPLAAFPSPALPTCRPTSVTVSRLCRRSPASSPMCSSCWPTARRSSAPSSPITTR